MKLSTTSIKRPVFANVMDCVSVASPRLSWAWCLLCPRLASWACNFRHSVADSCATENSLSVSDTDTNRPGGTEELYTWTECCRHSVADSRAAENSRSLSDADTNRPGGTTEFAYRVSDGITEIRKLQKPRRGDRQISHLHDYKGGMIMSHTYTRLLTHIVFSTKNRFPFMDAGLRSRLFPYMGGIIRKLDGKPILINGTTDHVHILASFPPRLALSDALRTVKANSSRWIHEQFPSHRKFAWQTGFGAFSVSYGHTERVRNYIANQERHHHRATFQDEFLNFLKEQEIEYDKKYIWD